MTERRPLAPNPAPPLGLGRVLGRTVSTWARSLPSYTALSVIVFLPLIAWTWEHTSAARTAEQTRTFDRWSGWAAMPLSCLLSAGLSHGVLEQIRGRRASVGRCLSHGLSRLLPVLGIAVLVFLLALLVVFAVMVPMAVVGAASKSDPKPVAYATLAIYLVVMAIVLTLYYVAIPVAVMERAGVGLSMRRSRALTRGNRWRLLVLELIWLVPGLGMDMVSNTLLSDSRVASKFATLGMTTLLLAPLGAISVALVYHDLRTGSEGATIEDLTKVFD